MKKSSLVVFNLVLILGLTACGQNSTVTKSVSNNSVEKNNIESVSNNSVEDNNIVSENTIVSSDLPEVEIVEDSDTEISEPCYFTSDKISYISDYLSQFTFINVIQTLENGIVDDLAKTSISYSVLADVKTDYVDFQTSNSYLYEGESGSGNHHYFKDYVNDITLEKVGDEWIEADGEIQMINWDIQSFENCNDIWNYLARDWQLPVDTEGYISENFEYYTIKSNKVDENFITGIKYDSLVSQEITYIYQNYGDNIYVPKSIIAEVIYTIGDKEYFVRSTIQLSTVGSSELTFPDYNKEQVIDASDSL